MKTKEIYKTPAIEIVEIELDDTIMTGSQTFDLNDAEEDYNGAAYSKKNTFWE